MVLGGLQDSYQQFQFQLSCKLARWAGGVQGRCRGAGGWTWGPAAIQCLTAPSGLCLSPLTLL